MNVGWPLSSSLNRDGFKAIFIEGLSITGVDVNGLLVGSARVLVEADGFDGSALGRIADGR